MSGSIARVVVPLDAASENREAIATAARLAAHARVPLHGVFVEDEDLLRLARLPFVRHVMPGPGLEPLSVETLERQLRAAAERARKELAAAAARHRIDWSFEVVRRANGPLLVAASEHDLVVAGALSRPVGGHFRVEWRWWSAIASIPGPLLLAQRGWDPGGSRPIPFLFRSSWRRPSRPIWSGAWRNSAAACWPSIPAPRSARIACARYSPASSATSSSSAERRPEISEGGPKPALRRFCVSRPQPHSMRKSSTSKIRVAFGGITPLAPLLP